MKGGSMIVDWIYNNPTWLWGTILVALSVAVSCGGLVIFHRLVHVSVRKSHNDLAVFTIAVIGVLYAVLLAFIAIATWESFSKASDIVESESDFAGGIYLDTQGLPQAKGQPIRDAVARYVSVVINEEWPIQRAGKTPDQGWKPLREINSAIATIQPQNLGEAVIQAELLKAWNELYQTRSSRRAEVADCALTATAAIGRINYYRRLINLPEVTEDETMSGAARKQAESQLGKARPAGWQMPPRVP